MRSLCIAIFVFSGVVLAQLQPIETRNAASREFRANKNPHGRIDGGGEQPYPVRLPKSFLVLQPKSARVIQFSDPNIGHQAYYIPNDLRYMRWGVLPNAEAKPIATVPSGSVVVFDVISHEGVLEDQGRDPVKYFGSYGIPPDMVLDDAKAVAGSNMWHNFYHDGPHVISPPVAVEGAEPGDVLRVDILRFEPRVPYGVNSIRHGLGALPADFPVAPSTEPGASPQHPDLYHNVHFVIPLEQEDGRWYGMMPVGNGQEARVPFQPFLGTMGVALDTQQLPSSVPPGKYGGNLDLHNLTAGSSLYLPVLVPGALFYVSDSHFAQGNGEVSLTAIEASLRATLRLTLLKKGSPDLPMPAPLQMPFAETANYWIPIGIADDLGDAMAVCVRQSASFLEHKLGFKPNNAVAFLSIGADFDVSEVVDQVKEVHAVIPKAALRQTRHATE